MAVEQSWQRGFAFVQLSPSDIETLIQPFAADARVLEAMPLTAGRRNTNYRLRLASQPEPVVLRLYSADATACHREIRLLRLVEQDIPVPKILHAEPDADPPWAITSWIEGARFDQFILTASNTPLEVAAYSAGRVLAAIHTYQFQRAGFFGPDLGIIAPFGPDDTWASLLQGWLLNGRAGHRLGADLTQRFLQFIADNGWRMEALSGQTSLLHADYKPWNLLLKDNAIAAVLDWEFAFCGTPLNDIGIFLRYSANLPPVYRTGFVKGYQDAGGQLPADWPRLARMIDLISLGYFLERPQDDPAVIRDVRPLIETTLRDFAP